VTTYKYLGLKKLKNLEGWNNIIAMAFIVTNVEEPTNAIMEIGQRGKP